ncbi:Tn3 family transposase [Streptomyces malaysiensis]|nr:Tn3 family transposase [Streptomyces malaysiensis]
MFPRIDLPDLLFEVHSWTGFLDAFGHVSERRTRMAPAAPDPSAGAGPPA